MRVSVGAPMSNNHATRIPPLPSSCLAYPNGKSCPLHYPVATLRPSHSNLWHCKPSGYNMTPPSSFYKTYKSYKSYASVTPTLFRIPPLPSSCPALPNGNFSPKPNHTAAPQALGVYRDAPFYQTSQTQASRHRDTHTPAAIKQSSTRRQKRRCPECFLIC